MWQGKILSFSLSRTKLPIWRVPERVEWVVSLATGQWQSVQGVILAAGMNRRSLWAESCYRLQRNS